MPKEQFKQEVERELTGRGTLRVMPLLTGVILVSNTVFVRDMRTFRSSNIKLATAGFAFSAKTAD
jgi:hypothetical protein